MAGAGVDFEVRVCHDEDYRESVGESVGFKVGRDEQLVVVGGENCFALGEQSKDISRELNVAMARGEREDGETGASGRLEVAGLDLGIPYRACGVVLLLVSILVRLTRGDDIPSDTLQQRPA